jgi:hypothetical protein
MADQGWVIMCPVVNIRHNYQVPVVARSCDWVGETRNVESGKVHLFGKGNGAYVAVRTVLDYQNVSLSVMGRPGTRCFAIVSTSTKEVNLIDQENCASSSTCHRHLTYVCNAYLPVPMRDLQIFWRPGELRRR